MSGCCQGAQHLILTKFCRRGVASFHPDFLHSTAIPRLVREEFKTSTGGNRTLNTNSGSVCGFYGQIQKSSQSGVCAQSYHTSICVPSKRVSCIPVEVQSCCSTPFQRTSTALYTRSSYIRCCVTARFFCSGEGVQDFKQTSSIRAKPERVTTMAEGGKQNGEQEKEILYPAVDTYGPITVKGCDLVPGKKMKWCTCGLSKKAPWCDGAHKKTGFRSLKWEVPEKPQSVYQICNCQYTKSPPFCDGTHTNLPSEVLERQKNCSKKDVHEECLKMCTGCGWKVDF